MCHHHKTVAIGHADRDVSVFDERVVGIRYGGAQQIAKNRCSFVK
jgi:hypothetical protein